MSFANAWPTLRAVAISVALALQLASAIPVRPLRAGGMSNPEGVRLVSWLQRMFSAVGVHRSQAEWTGSLIRASESVVALRNAAFAPFAPWFHYTQTGQQWPLFINPNRECFRLLVEARKPPRRRRERDWVLLYRAADVDRGRLSSMLRYRRLRGIYNASAKRGPHADYEGFASWLAGHLLAHHSKYASVRVSMERLAIGTPGSEPKSLGVEHVVVRQRSAIR
jgi:hypothetical protein